MLLDVGFLVQKGLSIMIPFARIASMMLCLPFYDKEVVGIRLRLILAFIVTLILVGLIEPYDINQCNFYQYIWLITKESFTGLSIGFVFRLLMHIVMSVGSVTDMMSGLGFAKILEPVHGMPVTIMSRFYYLLGVTLFVTIDGHLRLIAAMRGLFEAYPIGQVIFSYYTLSKVGESLLWGLQKLTILSLPIVSVSMAIMLAFATLSKRKLEFNIFSLGIPLILLSSFTICYFTIGHLSNVISLIQNNLLHLLGGD